MREFIVGCLPTELWKSSIDWTTIEELRLRCGQQAMALYSNREQVLPYIPERSDISKIVAALAEHSLHAYMEQIRQGFFTLRNGIRVGLGGRAVTRHGEICLMDDFTSLNIRFPRELRGLAVRLMPYITNRGQTMSTLLISPPQQGKTTLLRDIIRCTAQGEGCFGQKCTVIDEREELWGEAFSLGLRTDILRCNKKSGISMALRTLSPECIATDELGDPADFSAVFQAATAGVRILATAHGNSLSDLRCKPLFDEMYRHKVIDRFVVLSDSRGRGTVEQILDANGLPLVHQPLRLQSVEEGKQHVV